MRQSTSRMRLWDTVCAPYICTRRWQILRRRITMRSCLQRADGSGENMTQKKMFITGGIGSTVEGEAFTKEYELPNDMNYAETCASIGLVFLREIC